MSKDLNPEKALIFRIVHRESVAAMFRDGLHCSSSRTASTPFTQIGNLELIEKRKRRVVECPPGGRLPDYIPFYFTFFTPMMYNIKTGHNGVKQRPSKDIVILVSSLRKLLKDGIPFIFSDRHAYLTLTRFSSDLHDLSWIDWETLQARNFRKDNVDRFERYQAEALVHKYMPISALLGVLLGVVCYNDRVKYEVEAYAQAERLTIQNITKLGWYL